MALAFVVIGIGGDAFFYGKIWENHSDLNPVSLVILGFGGLIALAGFIWALINFVFNRN